LINFSI